MKITKEQYDSLPLEVIEFIKTCSGPIEFLPPMKKVRYSSGGISAKRMMEIENLTINILNEYWTKELKEQIQKFEK